MLLGVERDQLIDGSAQLGGEVLGDHAGLKKGLGDAVRFAKRGFLHANAGADNSIYRNNNFINTRQLQNQYFIKYEINKYIIAYI